MSDQPRLRQAPITALFGVLAIVATLARLTQQPVDFLYTTTIDTPFQPWRLVLSVFPHVNVYHIAFNVYWLWKLGTPLEPRLGHARYLGLLLFFALVSSAAEFAFLEGGIGLSGVVYGIFGLRWILERRHSPLSGGPMPQNTASMFIVWFFVCIGLTISKVLPVANIAHGVGAVTGMSVAYMLTAVPEKRAGAGAAVAAMTIVLLLLAFPFRPWVNLSREPAAEYTAAAYTALVAGRDEEGLVYLQRAIRYRNVGDYTWYDLGIAQERAGKFDAALASYRRAQEIDDKEEYRKAIKEVQAQMARSATRPETRPETQPGTQPETPASTRPEK
jgi:GlpG protein